VPCAQFERQNAPILVTQGADNSALRPLRPHYLLRHVLPLTSGFVKRHNSGHLARHWQVNRQEEHQHCGVRQTVMATQAHKMAAPACRSERDVSRCSFAPRSLPKAEESLFSAEPRWSMVLAAPLFLRTLLRLVFLCPHRHKGPPITPRQPIQSKLTGRLSAYSRETYVTCLDCGQRFAYDHKTRRLADFWGVHDPQALAGVRRRLDGFFSPVRRLAPRIDTLNMTVSMSGLAKSMRRILILNKSQQVHFGRSSAAASSTPRIDLTKSAFYRPPATPTQQSPVHSPVAFAASSSNRRGASRFGSIPSLDWNRGLDLWWSRNFSRLLHWKTSVSAGLVGSILVALAQQMSVSEPGMDFARAICGFLGFLFCAMALGCGASLLVYSTRAQSPIAARWSKRFASFHR
jgi:hypothetical protein